MPQTQRWFEFGCFDSSSFKSLLWMLEPVLHSRRRSQELNSFFRYDSCLFNTIVEYLLSACIAVISSESQRLLWAFISSFVMFEVGISTSFNICSVSILIDSAVPCRRSRIADSTRVTVFRCNEAWSDYKVQSLADADISSTKSQIPKHNWKTTSL